MFVARFLLCYTQDQYEHERLLIKEKLNYFIISRKELEIDSVNFDEKYNSLQKKKKRHYSHWALSIRAEDGVVSYSNHSEGFHKGIKKMSTTNASFPTRLKIFCYILEF